MGDHLRKVKTGDPLKLPARAFNTFIDTAEDFLNRQQDGGAFVAPLSHDVTVVPVRNDSGADVARFGVVAITGTMADVATQADAFKERVALVGAAPGSDAAGTPAVFIEPTAAGEIGSAVVSGVCPAQVDITAEWHEFADLKSGASVLTSHPHGSARILWAESGTGTKWAMVKLGVQDPPACYGQVVTTWAKPTPESGTWPTTITVHPCNPTMGSVDTGTTVTLWVVTLIAAAGQFQGVVPQMPAVGEKIPYIPLDPGHATDGSLGATQEGIYLLTSWNLDHDETWFEHANGFVDRLGNTRYRCLLHRAAWQADPNRSSQTVVVDVDVASDFHSCDSSAVYVYKRVLEWDSRGHVWLDSGNDSDGWADSL